MTKRTITDCLKLNDWAIMDMIILMTKHNQLLLKHIPEILGTQFKIDAELSYMYNAVWVIKSLNASIFCHFYSRYR